MLQTKDQGSRPYGFRQEDCFPYISLCKTCAPGVGPFLAQGHNLNKFGSGPLGDAPYQISRHQALRFLTRRFFRMMIPSARRRGRPKKTWSMCVKSDMKISSLGSIDPLNREAWGLGVRHSSHLLPTPVPGIPAAVEK